MKKVLIGLGFFVVLAIAAIVFLFAYSPSTPYIIISKLTFSRSRYPELYLIPQTREVSQSSTNSMDLHTETYYGLTFKSPFGQKIEKKTAGDLTALKFQNGTGILIRDKVDHQEFQRLNEEIKSEIAQKIKEKRLSENQSADYLNKFDFESLYDYYDTIYSTSPNQISIFSNKLDAVINIIRLTQKSISPIMNADYIYRFDTGKIKGFQLNMKDKKTIWLLIYDVKGDEYLITLTGNTYSQDEVDTILSSIDPA